MRGDSAIRESYTGGFVDDLFHGQGILIRAGGDRYVGQFRNGKAHGPEVLSNKEGRRLKEGNWQRGAFTGEWSLVPVKTLPDIRRSS
ncbi:MAG: hypothetical protein JXA20_08370 [Spirochaetes bacterium]|nr:hypothetical protein [Spirochaetota bacterium]